MSCRICMVIPGASECGKCCGAGCLPVSFGWLATVDGGKFLKENKLLTISPRALSRIHHNGKSTVSFVFPPCWLSPMGPTSTYQCSYLLCAGYVSGEGFHLRMLFGTSCPGYITARALPHRSDRHVPSRLQQVNALAVMCRLRFRPGLFLNGVFSIRTTVCWSFLRLSCSGRC